MRPGIPFRVEALVDEGVFAHAVEGYFLKVASRHDPVGIDIVSAHGDSGTGDLSDAGIALGHSRSRTSVMWPLKAAAATIAGLIRIVRPVALPCRPMKFRLDDDALISRPCSLSGFIARHIEHPAARQSN